MKSKLIYIADKSYVDDLQFTIFKTDNTVVSVFSDGAVL